LELENFWGFPKKVTKLRGRRAPKMEKTEKNFNSFHREHVSKAKTTEKKLLSSFPTNSTPKRPLKMRLA